jgi:hypothetical protein
VNGADPDQAQQDLGGLAGLPGLETVAEQLAGWVAVVKAELARRDAGVAVARPAWKNLVFTGGSGSGKSRAAGAVGRVCRALGVLSSGHLIEVSSAGLAGGTSRETGQLVREAASRACGGVLMITDARVYAGQRAGDQQVLRSLQEVLTERREDLVVILAGRADQLRSLLRGAPALASRFPATVDFPGYTAGQLAAIFAILAGEAGFTLSPAAVRAASSVLGRAHGDGAGGSARLAVRLLDQATASQARRTTTARQPPGPRCARSAPPTSPTWHTCKIRSSRRARTRGGLVRICSGCRWHRVPDIAARR